MDPQFWEAEGLLAGADGVGLSGQWHSSFRELSASLAKTSSHMPLAFPGCARLFVWREGYVAAPCNRAGSALPFTARLLLSQTSLSTKHLDAIDS